MQADCARYQRVAFAVQMAKAMAQLFLQIQAVKKELKQNQAAAEVRV